MTNNCGVEDVCKAVPSGFECLPLFSGGTCENGWLFFNGHCYLFSAIAQTWKEASATCVLLNGSLVKIEDQVEETWLCQHITYNTWIGAYRNGTNSFLWLDGSPVIYQNWAPKQPDGTGKCVALSYYRNTWRWDDYVCGSPRPFICEKL